MKRKEHRKERKSKKSFLSSEIRLQISLSIANPKPRFPNRTHPEQRDNEEEKSVCNFTFLLKVLRLTDPSYLLKKLKLREETDTGAEAPSTSNDEKPEEDSRVSTCEFHFSLKFILIFESCNQLSIIF